MPDASHRPAARGRTSDLPVVNSRSSKQEILQAFEELSARFQEQQERGLPARLEEEHRRHQQGLLETASRLSPEVVLKHISELKLQIASSLDGLGDGLLDARHKLHQVEQAIAIQTDRLKHLHDIQVAADTLDLLMEEHHRRTEQLELELESKRRELATRHKQAEAELEIERQRQKASLETELETHRARFQERDAALQRERQREEEDYQREQARRREAQEAAWQSRLQQLDEREAHLARFEAEWNRLQEEEANYPARLEEATRAAVTEAVARAREECQSQARLTSKDLEAQLSLAQLRIQALENAQRERDERLALLQTQLDAANAQVREIALRAIESSTRRGGDELGRRGTKG